MVIEYAGELIRSTLTDLRERYYNSRGIGCYMFKIDDHLVVDATMRGNAARFINHSCEVNVSEEVSFFLQYIDIFFDFPSEIDISHNSFQKFKNALLFIDIRWEIPHYFNIEIRLKICISKAFLHFRWIIYI